MGKRHGGEKQWHWNKESKQHRKRLRAEERAHVRNLVQSGDFDRIQEPRRTQGWETH